MEIIIVTVSDFIKETMLADEQARILKDVRADFREECNTKAALGKVTPAVSKSLEEETKDILQMVADGKWSVGAGVQGIVNLYADKGAVLLPFTQLEGPKQW